MLSIQDHMDRFGEILAQLDALAADSGSEELEELNAEFEDALMLLGELKPMDPNFAEDLADTLEELQALAGDYLALSKRLPRVDGLARRLASACGQG